MPGGIRSMHLEHVFRVSKPIVVACSMGASFGGSSTPSPWHTDAVGGRPPHHPTEPPELALASGRNGGHEERLPPSRLSGRCRFAQETFAGTHGNGQDAPKAAIWTRGIGLAAVNPKLPFAPRDIGRP